MRERTYKERTRGRREGYERQGKDNRPSKRQIKTQERYNRQPMGLERQAKEMRDTERTRGKTRDKPRGKEIYNSQATD